VFKPVSATDFEGKKALYRNSDFRSAFREKMATVREQFRSSFSKTVVSQCLAEPGLDERRLLDIAEARGVPATDLLLDLALADNLETRFRMPVANHNEDAVEPLLKSGSTVLGLSDAGAHASQLCDACQPTYLLSRWVREKQVFSIEEAVRMLTSRPAEVAGIADRGLLAKGHDLRPRHRRGRAAETRTRLPGRGRPPGVPRKRRPGRHRQWHTDPGERCRRRGPDGRLAGRRAATRIAEPLGDGTGRNGAVAPRVHSEPYRRGKRAAAGFFTGVRFAIPA